MVFTWPKELPAPQWVEIEEPMSAAAARPRCRCLQGTCICCILTLLAALLLLFISLFVLSHSSPELPDEPSKPFRLGVSLWLAVRAPARAAAAAASFNAPGSQLREALLRDVNVAALGCEADEVAAPCSLAAVDASAEAEAGELKLVFFTRAPNETLALGVNRQRQAMWKGHVAALRQLRLGDDSSPRRQLLAAAVAKTLDRLGAEASGLLELNKAGLALDNVLLRCDLSRPFKPGIANFVCEGLVNAQNNFPAAQAYLREQLESHFGGDLCTAGDQGSAFLGFDPAGEGTLALVASCSHSKPEELECATAKGLFTHLDEINEKIVSFKDVPGITECALQMHAVTCRAEVHGAHVGCATGCVDGTCRDDAF